MAEKFVLDLNSDDWRLLEDEAKEEGYKNSTAMIRDRIRLLSLQAKAMNDCAHNNKQRRRNQYPLTPEQQEAFDKLACRHSSSVSGVLFRYIICPIFTKALLRIKKPQT